MNESSDYLTASSIYFDFFPASIYNHESGRFVHLSDQFRVIATDRYLIGWAHPGEVAFLKKIVTAKRKSFKEWEVIATDDDLYTVARVQGCGCGSSLRSFHPFQGVPFAARF